MNNQQKQLQKQLRKIGLSENSIKRYASGDWRLLPEIQEKIKTRFQDG